MSSYQIFLACAGCGVVSGVIYDFLYIIRSLVCGMPAAVYTLKDKIFTAVCDVIYFASLAAIYIFCAIKLNFPDLRLYMMAAIVCGSGLYIKSCHKIIAFLAKNIYNRIAKR